MNDHMGIVDSNQIMIKDQMEDCKVMIKDQQEQMKNYQSKIEDQLEATNYNVQANSDNVSRLNMVCGKNADQMNNVVNGLNHRLLDRDRIMDGVVQEINNVKDEIEEVNNRYNELCVIRSQDNRTMQAAIREANNSNQNNSNQNNSNQNNSNQTTQLPFHDSNSESYMALIKYDNELLNHPEILKEASQIYSMNKVIDLSNQISPLLMNEIIEDNNGDLLLGALMSLEDGV